MKQFHKSITALIQSHFRYNNSRLLAPVLAISMLMLIAGVALAAWAPDFSSSPYTGNFSKTTTANAQVGFAQYVKWNSARRQALQSDSNPQFDMTADCSANSPVGDKLSYNVFFTNIPNSGAQIWNDCGGPPKEEVDLKINKSSVQAETAYYYQVHYNKLQYGIAGEINLSYQRDNSPTHDHLDKVVYSN